MLHSGFNGHYQTSNVGLKLQIGPFALALYRGQLMIAGDVSQLYKMELKPGHWAAFAEDCVGSAKRVTMMKVLKFLNNRHTIFLLVNALGAMQNIDREPLF